MLPHPQRRLILYRTAPRLSRVFSLFSLGPPSRGDDVYYNRLLRKCQPLFQKNFVAAARRPCSCQRGEIGGSCARQHGPRRQSAGADGAPLSIPAAPSFASPRRDGGGAFIHPRGPVLRQPPLRKGGRPPSGGGGILPPSSALGAGIPVSSAPPPAWPTAAGSPEAQRRMSRCKTGIQPQQARRSGPSPPGPWRPC